MSDDRITKVGMYSQLHAGKRHVDKSLHRYKEKLKSNLKYRFYEKLPGCKEWKASGYNCIND